MQASGTTSKKNSAPSCRYAIVGVLATIALVACLPRALLAGERDLAAERALERKCIDCHDDPDLHGSNPDGKLRSVFVDPERYKKSIHTEKDLTCLSCHPNALDEYHCREGVEITPCGSCHDHEDELADFSKSRHGKHLEDKVENAADCQDCHSNHYTRKKDDPESAVHPSRICGTCGSCHASQARLTPGTAGMASGRFSVHGKADLSEDYSIDDCSRCHFSADTHRIRPEEEIDRCAACHRRDEGGKGSPVMGPVHFEDDGLAGLAFSSLRTVGSVAVLLAPLLLLGFFAAFRRMMAPPKKKKEAGSDE